MPRVRLSFNSHYPTRVVRVTEEELERMREVAVVGSLAHHPHGYDLIDDLNLYERDPVEDPIPTFVIYE